MSRASGNVQYTFDDKNNLIGCPKNITVRDIPLAGNAANQPNTQFGNGGAEGNDVIPKPPTGNINIGTGPGAINLGRKAASAINCPIGEIDKLFKVDAAASVPPGGNINKGVGAGGVNYGEESASINGCK